MKEQLKVNDEQIQELLAIVQEGPCKCIGSLRLYAFPSKCSSHSFRHTIEIHT